MNDKIVTHEDLDLLREMREQADYGRIHQAPLLDRLIAAAEADQPPLPEGWVLHTTPAGSRAVFWHRDGYLYQWDDDDDAVHPVQPFPSSTTVPLRPTVTEADVEKATEAWLSDLEMLGVHPEGGLFQTAKGTIRAAFKAAGIEVTP